MVLSVWRTWKCQNPDYDARHITGDHPNGAGDLFAHGTTRNQIEDAIMKVIAKGNRTTDPNRVITFFPVRGGGDWYETNEQTLI